MKRERIAGIGIAIAYALYLREDHRPAGALFRVRVIQTDFIATPDVEAGNKPSYGRRKEEGRFTEPPEEKGKPQTRTYSGV